MCARRRGVLTPGGDGARAGALLLAGEGLVALAAATLPAQFRGPAAALLLLGMLLQPVPLLDAALGLKRSTPCCSPFRWRSRW
ncbi:MAG: hypothetical protein U0133_01450 [Gemmatimonadales bacterium]